jgi:putative sterol carrier protein
MPSSCKAIFDAMPSSFKPEAAQGLDAVYQFDLSGDGGGKWYVVIKNQTCEVHEGGHPSPSVTLSMTAQDYVDMINGQANGQVLFMTGRLRIAGDLGLAIRMQSLFQQG